MPYKIPTKPNTRVFFADLNAWITHPPPLIEANSGAMSNPEIRQIANVIQDVVQNKLLRIPAEEHAKPVGTFPSSHPFWFRTSVARNIGLTEVNFVFSFEASDSHPDWIFSGARVEVSAGEPPLVRLRIRVTRTFSIEEMQTPEGLFELRAVAVHEAIHLHDHLKGRFSSSDSSDLKKYLKHPAELKAFTASICVELENAYRNGVKDFGEALQASRFWRRYETEIYPFEPNTKLRNKMLSKLAYYWDVEILKNLPNPYPLQDDTAP